tara:strand:+ start:1218 stop:2648 length:1431 start_codon:yes stop_codon:yes gene_type:complete
MENNIYKFLILLFSVLFVTSTTAQRSINSQRPNIIVIMTDDLGYADVGFNGSKDIPTPNIDRIAQQGVVFTNGYTSYSVCSPSRAGFITGRYQQRFGYERNVQHRPNDPNMGLPQDEKTLAEVLKKVGYNTGIIGKWHLGNHISKHPLNRGFDYFYGHLGGGHMYFPKLLTIKDSRTASELETYRTWILENHTPVKTTKYLTDEFSEKAVSFIEQQKSNPFFLFVSYNAPHTPLQASEKYLQRFTHIEDKKRKTYAAMVSAVDDGVGEILNKLKTLGLEENTLVYFLSDNGGPEHRNASDNGPLRAGKSSIYEGGNRVPFAFRWPQKIPQMVYRYPVSALDIFSTVAAVAEVPIEYHKPLDGKNLIPFLTGVNKSRPHQTLFIRKFDDDLFSVIHGDYKLITKKSNKIKEIYDLNNDLSEQNNIAKEHPEIVAKLDSLRINWNNELIDPVFLGLIHTEMWKNRKKKTLENNNHESK